MLIPSFYASYQTGLAAAVRIQYTPLVLLVIAGVLILVGAALGPETRDVDMAATGPEELVKPVAAGSRTGAGR